MQDAGAHLHDKGLLGKPSAMQRILLAMQVACGRLHSSLSLLLLGLLRLCISLVSIWLRRQRCKLIETCMGLLPIVILWGWQASPK